MKTFLYTFLILLSVNGQAQEVLFLQPYSTPTNINPAMTGAFNAKNRLTVQYHQAQQGSSFSGSSVSFDHKYTLPNADYIGFGANIASKELYILDKTVMKSAVAYGKYLGGSAKMQSQYLVASGGVDYQQNLIDLYKLYNTNGNFNDPLGGFLPNRYMDVSIGALWYAAWKKGRRAYFGFAWHHINKPNIGFYEKEPMAQRFTFNIGGEIPIAMQLRWVPIMIYSQQGNTRDMRAGLSLKITAQDTLGLSFGASVRKDNTLIFSKSVAEPIDRRTIQFFFRLDNSHSTIQLSYDILGSGYGLNNAFEMTYTYIWGETRHKSKWVPVW